MAETPTGTVTFLFTDIEGSTRLWEESPDAMRLALARHDALLRAAIETNGGHVFKTGGDAFCAAFPTATQAIDAALIGQQHLLASSSSPLQRDLELKVRMALHSGEAEVRAGDYFGSALSRVSRLLSIGYGRQVLVSAATKELVRDDVPAEASLKELGSHRLRDLTRPEEVFQLCHPDLPGEFPALRSLDYLPNNLPRQLTSFIGREKEIAESLRLLGATSLLTLVGSGGCGKTRLALQVAADLLHEYVDGVWQVELAPLADPALVPQAVAAVLDVKEQAGRTLVQTLSEYLRPRQLLLMLDNAEHLLASCASLVETLLRACPNLRMLVTSREGLAIAGETTYRIPSLSSPDPKQADSPEALSQYEAVRLFIDRALAVQPGFGVTNQNAPAVAQLCHRLDGIPLAIELAAARVRAMPVEQIASRLDDRFRLLTGGSRTALPRQQTLRALIDWSYDLLTQAEKAVLIRLSVFAGGWTLEAAEKVCAGGVVEEWEVLDLLTALVDRSLVLYDEGAAGGRYRLLETVRQYAREKLAAQAESEVFRQQHRDYYLSVAEAAERKLFGAEQREWLERLQREHDNLRAAMELCAADPAAGEAGLRLAWCLHGFWDVRAYLREGRERSRAALAHPGAQAASAVRAMALLTAGCLAFRQTDFVAAEALLQEAVEIHRRLNDEGALEESLRTAGLAAASLGDYDRARSLTEESVALCRKIGKRAEEAISVNNLGVAAELQGDFAGARSFYTQARQTGALQNPGSICSVLSNLARVTSIQGELSQARSLLSEAIRIVQEIGERRLAACNLETLAGVEIQDGHHPRAARLLGAAAAVREQVGAPPFPTHQRQIDRCLGLLREVIAEEDFQAAFAAGRSLSWEQAIACTLGGTDG